MSLGRILITLGVVALLAGGIILLLEKTGVPWGRLPGDLAYRGKNVSFYFPLGTCLLLSVLLSLAFYLVNHFRR